MVEPALSPGQPRADLLDPAALARLGGIEFVARKVVEGFLQGLHRSPHRGFSAEFAELRGYQPGDDLRHIDWRMFARSERFYVKQFEQETNLRAWLLLDASASMGWSSAPGILPTKFWYAQQLAASLALILIRQGDAVGALAFDDRIRDRVEARGGRVQWRELSRRLGRIEAAGATRPTLALREIATRLRRRGLVILLSDLLADPVETRRALGYLRHQGHEVLVMHLLDPGERELPGTGDVRFVDPEGSGDLVVHVGEIHEAYREAVQRAIDEWERALVPGGIDYVVVDTDRPMSLALRAYLRKRERLG